MGATVRASRAAEALVYALAAALAVSAIVGQRAARAEATIAWPLATLLVALAAWRLVEAILDVGGTARSDPLARAGRALSGVTLGGLGIAALQAATATPLSPGPERVWIDRALRTTAGPELLGVAGGAIVLFGLAEIYRALAMRPPAELPAPALVRAAVFGRGIAAALIGSGAVQAALAGPRPGGIGGGIRALAAEPAGAALLAIVAAGLAAHALLSLARVRRPRRR